MEEPNRRNIVRGSHSTQKTEQARRFRIEMTAAEARLWEWVRRSALGALHFRRQQVIDGFIVDFYCHSASIAVEVDGASHTGRADYDQERTEMLERRGILVLRFPNHRIENDLGAVLKEIRVAACARLSTDVPATRRRLAAERRNPPAP